MKHTDISLSSCKQKIEWLEAVNKKLLKVCKRVLADFRNAKVYINQLEQAIAKAEKGE